MSDCWVLVITGSGVHSPEGPVLRTCVEALLKKRQMHYTINKGRGSFSVKANSGIVLYDPELPTDSKVIVKPAPESVPALPKPSRARFNPLSYDGEAPTPLEAAETDKAIEESRKDQQEAFREQKKEEKLLKRAVSMSLLQAKEEEDKEKDLLERALSMSRLECDAQRSAEDEELQRAMELSMTEVVQRDTDISDDVQRALKLSRQVSSREDEELLQVLELSKLEFESTELWAPHRPGYDVEEVD